MLTAERGRYRHLLHILGDTAAPCLVTPAAGTSAHELLERLPALPLTHAHAGLTVSPGRVYLQEAEQPLTVVGGVFQQPPAAPMTPALTLLMHKVAELAIGAPDLEEAAYRVLHRVAAGLGWQAVGFSVFGPLPPQRALAADTVVGEDIDPLQHAPRWDNGETALLIVPVRHGEQLLGALVFGPPRPEWDAAVHEVLTWVAAQLAAVSVRARAQDGRLHRQVEIARQGRLTGMAELAHTLASELSQPLAAAMNYAGALRRTVGRGNRSPAELTRLTEQLIDQVKRAGEILHSVKDCTLHQSPPLAALDVAQPIERVLELLEGELRAHGVALALVLDSELPPVRANPAYLEQILLNVIGQAIESMAAAAGGSPEFAMRVERVGPEVRIVFSAGGGSSAWLQPIFEPMGGSQDSSRRSLQLSRSLAEAQGGRLWIQENAGEANFVLALPVSG
jgi:signal transduction histidine kinase